jgi:hypothetical protein
VLFILRAAAFESFFFESQRMPIGGDIFFRFLLGPSAFGPSSEMAQKSQPAAHLE